MRFSVQTWFYLLTDKHTFCTWTHESSVLSWSGSNTVRLFKLMVNSLKTHQWCNDMDVCMELIMSTKLQETWHTRAKMFQHWQLLSLCFTVFVSSLCQCYHHKVFLSLTGWGLCSDSKTPLDGCFCWMDSSGTVLLRCLSSINTHWLRFESVTSQHCWTAACEAEKFQH